MKKGDEIITLKIVKEEFERLYNEGFINLDSDKIKLDKVEPLNEEYPDDPTWVKLNKACKEAYKKRKDYEYFKRHNIRPE
jgi:hypothetical protein